MGPLTLALALGPLASPALAPAVVPRAPLPTLTRLALALGVGLFVGLEREWRGHEAGLRTFGFAALLGGLGGRLGEAYALLSLGLLGLLVGFLIWQSVRAEAGTELTTSAALLVTGFAGVLCGQGHTFTPVAVATLSAALLAWKERLAGFSLGLTAAELRSAILLGLLAFVVYPALPEAPLDPWGLVAPRTAWATVVLLAGIGFANYILWKRYGSAGVVVTGFLGGLVNSTVVVTELATRVRASRSAGADAGAGGVADGAYRGVLLATAAMLARNAVLLGLLAAGVLVAVAGPLAAMLAASAGLAFAGGGPVAGTWSPGRARRPDPAVLPGPAAPPAAGLPAGGGTGVHLESPFSLPAALKFGALFLALQVAGALAQAALGQAGFYAVSVVGGLVSSASAVASAAALAARGALPPGVAATGVVLASLASAGVNVALVARFGGDRPLTRRLGRALSIVVLAGLLGAGAQLILWRIAPGVVPAGVGW